MKNFIFTVIMLMTIGVCEAGDHVTEYTQKFGSGTLTRRSDGSTMTTQRFGSGYIQRESFRSGRSATHISTRFGSGYLRRSSGSYVRRP
jgi:hypothetical protein